MLTARCMKLLGVIVRLLMYRAVDKRIMCRKSVSLRYSTSDYANTEGAVSLKVHHKTERASLIAQIARDVVVTEKGLAKLCFRHLRWIQVFLNQDHGD